MFSALTMVLIPAGILLALLAIYLTYVAYRYAPIIGRIFEEAPVFHPLRVAPEAGGEEVRFPTPDGLELAGTYARHRAESRAGVIVFCHEYLSDRWSAGPYVAGLRELGFDVFSFDFRNHGDSLTDESYAPLQWVSDFETADLRSALAYLRTRADRDPAGVGLFGISRGGGAALCVAAEDMSVWGVVTDGAFAARGTMLSYIRRWAEIYISASYRRLVPWPVLVFAGWAGRVRTEWRRGRHYEDVERAVARISPRPWLSIHGARDNYINAEIARDLFSHAREPKELWIVPKAKHNRCREADPEGYRQRLGDFFSKWAPRRASEPVEIEVATAPPRRGAVGKPVAVAEVAAPVPG